MSQLAIDFARAARDEGIQRAADNAEARLPGWQERALGYVREYCVYHKQFTGEDIRLFAEEHGFEVPPHKRAWGAVMLSAARQRIVRNIGTRKVNNPKAHQAIATLWEAA